MPNHYTITVTAPATVSTLVTVIASSPDEANELALKRARHPDAQWALDDADYSSDMYLPDPDEAEHSETPIYHPMKPLGDVILVTQGNAKAIVLRTQEHYVLINHANTASDIEVLEDEARTLAASLGTEVRNLNAQRNLPEGQWDEVTRWMNTFGDRVLIELWQDFRDKHELGKLDLSQIAKIKDRQIFAWAKHLLERWLNDTGVIP